MLLAASFCVMIDSSMVAQVYACHSMSYFSGKHCPVCIFRWYKPACITAKLQHAMHCSISLMHDSNKCQVAGFVDGALCTKKRNASRR